MQYLPKNRLALVPQPVPTDAETQQSWTLGRQLEEILREQLRADPTGDFLPIPTSHDLATRHLPFSIRLTMEQALTVAEDADLRAHFLEMSVEGLPDNASVQRKVSSLHEIADDVRSAATRLIERSGDPNGSP